MLAWILCAVLCAVIMLLAVKIQLLRKSMDEIGAAFKERLCIDTNTLISISSRDAHARRLATSVNTQLRLLRKQRRQYMNGDWELKEAVTNISHDLRTPLTAICGYLDLLEDEQKSETTARYLSYISNRAEALKQLTEELFRYSVILSTGSPQRHERFSLNTALEESLAAFYPELTARGILPNIQIPDRKLEVYLDKSAVSRVYGNLLNNALKYSAGDLTVQLCENGDTVFTNLAPGLDKVEVGRLFNRFFTVETARNSTGLGLAISKALVERMKGEITAQYSDNKLSIRVCLPLGAPG